MSTPGEHSERDEVSEKVMPNRVLLFLEPGSSTLKEYPGEEELIRYIHTLPSQEQQALREGVTLSMRCANGIFECTLNTENGDIYVTPINPIPKAIQVHFHEDIFPGDGQLLGFLQERLTKRYKIGTCLALHFLDKSVSYEISLVPACTVEGVSKGVSALVGKSLATS